MNIYLLISLSLYLYIFLKINGKCLVMSMAFVDDNLHFKIFEYYLVQLRNCSISFLLYKD